MNTESTPETPQENPELISRRKFLTAISLALGAFAAAIVTVPIIGVLITPFIQKKQQVWRSIGPVSKFKVGTTVSVSFENASPEPWAGVTAYTAAWLRRNSETEFTAFSVNCTHLGCPVRWVSDSELFLCPCHGGVYNDLGDVVAGPPPYPLPKYPVRVNNGQVEIQTSPVPLFTYHGES